MPADEATASATDPDTTNGAATGAEVGANTASATAASGDAVPSGDAAASGDSVASGDAAATAWIAVQTDPGRLAFRFSAFAEVASTIALIAQWALLGAGIAAWMSGTGSALGLFIGVGIAAPVRLLLRVLATRLAEVGRKQIITSVRTGLVPELLAASGRTRANDAADVLIDHVPVVAGYLAGSGPLRIAAVPSTLLILAAVALVHWPVAVLLVLCTALLPLNLRLAGQATVNAGRRQLAASRRLSAIVTESVRGLPTLVSLRATARRRTVLGRASTRLEKSTLRVLTYAFLSGAVMDVAVTFAIAVSATYTGLVLLGFVTLPGTPALNLGGALFVLLLCPAYFAPAQRAARGFHDRDDALVAARAILEASAAASGPVASGHVASGAGASRSGSAPVPAADPAPGAISAALAFSEYDEAASASAFPYFDLREVSVVDGSTRILDEVSLTVPAGQWTAVSGPSGSGKTTLLQLLAGNRAPSAGTIDRAAAQPHGWLGSDTVVLGTTLAENISLGDASIDSEAVRAAAHVAGLDPVIADLPEGIGTVLGTTGGGASGRKLSAGERRRVAVARLVAADRRLWILDEPTAHLDRATESAILETLRRASVGRTVVVATHSSAVMAAADRVCELRDGAVVAAGPSADPRPTSPSSDSSPTRDDA
ncbi:ATP-binding cassette domain-containing protein [Brevibacterium metallidurans]|uniref:Thiol reductant ABC exporter subunit CydD n=1 Tax=Brevibacterium metallidurans TaxID=1482676 RepID=A0ABN0SSQ5_9MICO